MKPDFYDSIKLKYYDNGDDLDDALEAFWYPLTEDNLNNMYASHGQILRLLKNW